MKQDFLDAVSSLVGRLMEDSIHTSAPSKVGKVENNHTAKLTPNLKVTTDDGREVPYPEISGTIILMPCGAGGTVGFAFPVKSDDGCLALFNEGGSGTDLKWDLSNAALLPGLYQSPGEQVKKAGSEEAAIMFAPSSTITVTKDKIEIKKDDTKITVTSDSIKMEKGSTTVTASSSSVDVTSPSLNIKGNTKVNAYEPVYTPEDGRALYEQMQTVSDYIISRRMDVTITMLDDLLGGQAKDDTNFCGGTGAMLSFAPDGSAYPCIRYAPISIGEEKAQKVRFGSVYDGLYATDAQRQAKEELDAITRTSQSPQECLECPVSAGCGWCSGLNYELFGTANKRSTAICWAHKARVLASCYYHDRRYLEIGDCLPIEVRLPAEDGLKILPAEKWAELMHIETAALMKFADEIGIS